MLLARATANSKRSSHPYTYQWVERHVTQCQSGHRLSDTRFLYRALRRRQHAYAYMQVKTKAAISSPTPISTPLLRPLGPQVLAACFHRNLSRLGLAATPDCQHRIGIKSNHSAHPWIVRRACIAVLRRFKTPPISCPLRKDNYIATMPSWTTEDVLFRRTNDQHLQDNFPRS
jgi:hypothetical protein